MSEQKPEPTPKPTKGEGTTAGVEKPPSTPKPSTGINTTKGRK